MENLEIKTGVVVQHNAVVEGCYSLTLIEQRIIRTFITGLRRDASNDRRVLILSVIEFNQLFGSNDSQSSIKASVTKLFSRHLTIAKDYIDPDGVTWSGGAKFQFVSMSEFSDGKIRITFNDKIMIFFENLINQFTSYAIEDVIGLTTSYGMRFFELLKQYEAIGSRIITTDDIRKILGLEHKYKQAHNFYIRVIKAAIDDINNHSDYRASAKPIKEHRKIIAYAFTFIKNESLDTMLNGFIKKTEKAFTEGRHVVVGGREIHYIKGCSGVMFAHTKYSKEPLIHLLESSNYKFTIV